MKKPRTCIVAVCGLLASCLMLCSCFPVPKPLSAAEMEKMLLEHYGDFAVVCDYLLSLENHEAFIRMNDDKTSFFSGFKDHGIADEAVLESLENLDRIGCYYVSKDIDGNCVVFGLWYRGADVSCGVLFRIDPDRETELQFLTDINETSIKGWFTYVEDYNEWRKNQ